MKILKLIYMKQQITQDVYFTKQGLFSGGKNTHIYEPFRKESYLVTGTNINVGIDDREVGEHLSSLSPPNPVQRHL